MKILFGILKSWALFSSNTPMMISKSILQPFHLHSSRCNHHCAHEHQLPAITARSDCSNNCNHRYTIVALLLPSVLALPHQLEKSVKELVTYPSPIIISRKPDVSERKRNLFLMQNLNTCKFIWVNFLLIFLYLPPHSQSLHLYINYYWKKIYIWMKIKKVFLPFPN